MVHAMAPRANIILVEAASNLATDLLGAVTVAGSLVADAGGGEVSMSWAGVEFSNEASNDSVFTTPGVVYIAGTGDSPRAPKSQRFSKRHRRRRHHCAPQSFYRRPHHKGRASGRRLAAVPSFRAPATLSERHRRRVPTDCKGNAGRPDLSFDSNPDSGVWIYDSFAIIDFPNGGVYGSNWYVFGGTSVAAPSLTGIINVGGHFSSSSALELTRIYNHLTFTTDYHDIVSGNCGPYDGFSAVAGWDYSTGVGTPFGYGGK